MAKIYLSKKKLKKLKGDLKNVNAELDSLRKEKSLAYTSAGDTWHDNPYFNKLEQDEQNLARKIVDLQNTIAQAEVYTSEPRNTEEVRLGSIVRFLRRYEKTGEETIETWEIVGFGETDVSRNQVAYNAPLADAILGLKRGDVKEGVTPKGVVEYEIIDLYPSWDAVPKATS